MLLAVMDTHIRWKVKRRITDAHITLAVILLFVTSQTSSGKMRCLGSAGPCVEKKKVFLCGSAGYPPLLLITAFYSWKTLQSFQNAQKNVAEISQLQIQM